MNRIGGFVAERYSPGMKIKPAAKQITDVVHAMCRYIEAYADAPLTLSAIAKKSGYSAAHLQRNFTAIVGSSPKAYQTMIRNRTLKAELRGDGGVSDAIYGAGFGSASRVYEKRAANLGMTPGQYRAKGQDVAISFAAGQTALGLVMIGATERGICFLQFGKQAADLQRQLAEEFPKAALMPMASAQADLYEDWMRALNRYLDGKSALRELPLDIRGTAFQLLVWRYLQTIPAGEVRSYAEVAAALKKPKAIRAVASACARNNIGLLIPCHRVLRGDGNLAGYRWGLERKRALLDLERRKKV